MRVLVSAPRQVDCALPKKLKAANIRMVKVAIAMISSSRVNARRAATPELRFG